MFTVQKSLVFDPIRMKMLAMNTAATILVICESRDPAVAHSPSEGPNGANEDGYDPIAQKLSGYVSWAADGYTGSLQAMIEFVYDYVTVQLNDSQEISLHSPGEKRVITDALRAYQVWKTAFTQAERNRLGNQNFGISSEFNTKDWTDQNELFLFQWS